MSVYGVVPAEPHRQTALDLCAPKFEAAVMALLRDMQEAGFDPVVFESLRTNERQCWLYGFGRDYDDGRGIVTHAQTAMNGWHFFGLAADIISESKAWDAPPAFWNALAGFATVHGLTWGGDWPADEKDEPHVQWGKPMRDRPSDFARQLYTDAGIPAVWREVGAD